MKTIFRQIDCFPSMLANRHHLASDSEYIQKERDLLELNEGWRMAS